MDTTKKIEIEDLAKRLIDKYLASRDGGTWSFEWQLKRKQFGTCCYGPHTIQLSLVMMKGETMDAIEQTLRHEVAHALADPAAGHGARWKRVARSIGVRDPKSRRSWTADESDRPEPKWVLVYRDEIISRYYRRPTAKRMMRVHQLYARGREAETLGCLKYMPYADYLAQISKIHLAQL